VCRTIAAFAFSVFVVAPDYADTIHVPQDQPTVQAAIDASLDGDTVLVGPGTYLENIDFRGKDITVRATVPAEDATVIDGSSPSDPHRASTVIFDSGEGPTAVLQGFTIVGGSGSLSEYIYGGTICGGGVFCEEASPTILHNFVKNNSAVLSGGIFTNYSSATIIGNTIKENTAVQAAGGVSAVGMGAGDRSLHMVKIIGNVITDNASGNHAGAVEIAHGGNAKLIGNLIAGNSSNGAAGVFVMAGVRTVIINNTIIANVASIVRGSGIRVGGAPFIINNIVVDNIGGGIFQMSPEAPSPMIAYNNVWRNTGGDYINCNPGNGDISADPLFVDPDNGDLRILLSSPCIDAGDPSLPVLTGAGSACDIGAFEYFNVPPQGVRGSVE
jgi:hypothetical protein